MDLERGEAETLEYGRVVFGDLWDTTHNFDPSGSWSYSRSGVKRHSYTLANSFFLEREESEVYLRVTHIPSYSAGANNCDHIKK
jgi:hypothetical protein